MTDTLVRRGTLLTVITLVVVILGIAAALRIPVQMIPDLEVRRVSVETQWPGATPQDIEKEILVEQEEYLRTIPGLSRLKSFAATGRAEIELEFPFGVDITRALLDVNNALAQVPSYPENVDEPRVSASSFSQNSFMYLRVSPAPGNPLGLDMDLMQDFVDDHVRPRLERVEGVSQVGVGGGAPRQVRVEVDTRALAERGLSLWDVRSALRLQNRDRSAGDIDSGKRRYLLRSMGRFRDLDALRELIISPRGEALVRLRDVATVTLDHAEPRSRSFTDGEAAIGLSVRRLAGSNVIQIKRELLPVIEQVNEQVLAPVGLKLRLLTDDVKYVKASVTNVWINLGLGALLATAVMFAFLRRLPATLVGVMGIPLCTLAAFIGLLWLGRTINVISLAGIAFAIGMTLDNTIVVLEAIERQRRKGLDRFDAAARGLRQVWPAVLASTLTTVLVFAPILFIAEEAGQLYSDVAIAISAAILTSMLVATTLVPAASARLRLGDAETRTDTGHSAGGRLMHMVRVIVAKRTRQLTCLVTAVLLAAAVLLGLTPAAEYLPEGEEPKTFARMIAPPGYNLTEMLVIAEQLQAELLPHVRSAPDDFENGRTDVPPMAYMNLGVDASGLRIIAETVDPDHIGALMGALTRRYEAVPGMRAFAARGSIISSNDGGTRSVNVDISGADLPTLFATAQALFGRAKQALDEPQIGSEPSSLRLTQPMIEVRPNWERLREMQIDLEAFRFSVAALADGAYVDEFFFGDDKVDIYLYGEHGHAQSLSALPTLGLPTPDGAVVPLSALAELRETVDTDQIRRINGERTVTLNIISPPDVALETAVGIVQREVIDAARAAGDIPDTVIVDISGASDQLSATRAALGGNFLIAVMLSYLLLVAIFSHWGYPLLILLTVPLGLAGGVAGLALLNVVVQQSFDLISMLGFLILLGTVVNNPILIVDRTLHELREGAARVEDAVLAAVETRLRPILISTLTTLMGLSPLVFMPGAGTELYRGVGAIVLFGLLCSMIVTLTVLPALLCLVLRRHPQSGVPAAHAR